MLLLTRNPLLLYLLHIPLFSLVFGWLYSILPTHPLVDLTMYNPPQPLLHELTGGNDLKVASKLPVARPASDDNLSKHHTRARSYVNDAATGVTILLLQVQTLLSAVVDSALYQVQRLASRYPELYNTLSSITSTTTSRLSHIYHSSTIVRTAIGFVTFWTVVWISLASLITISIVWPLVLISATVFLVHLGLFTVAGVSDSYFLAVDNREYKRWALVYSFLVVSFIPVYVFGPLGIVCLSVGALVAVFMTNEGLSDGWLAFTPIPMFVLLTTPYWSVFWFFAYIPVALTMLGIELSIAIILAVIAPTARPGQIVKSFYLNKIKNRAAASNSTASSQPQTSHATQSYASVEPASKRAPIDDDFSKATPVKPAQPFESNSTFSSPATGGHYKVVEHGTKQAAKLPHSHAVVDSVRAA